MKKKLLMILAVAMCSILFTSCATLMAGNDSNQITVNSTVPNSKVYVNNIYRGMAPVVLDLNDKDSYTVKVMAPGYTPYVTPVKKTLSGWFWGNILLGGPIGMIVDLMTGKAFKMKSIDAQMSK